MIVVKLHMYYLISESQPNLRTYILRQCVCGDERGGDLSGPEGECAPRLQHRYERKKPVQY